MSKIINELTKVLNDATRIYNGSGGTRKKLSEKEINELARNIISDVQKALKPLRDFKENL